MAISDDERAFFARLGAHIAELRRAQDITQVQTAETLGVSQQTINSYEVGHGQVPVSALPTLARTLRVSLEALIGEKTPPVKRGLTPKFQQQLERLGCLPQAQQSAVMEMLEGVYLATSGDVQGLIAQGRTIQETIEIARDVAKKLIEAQTGTRLPTIAELFDYPVIVAT